MPESLEEINEMLLENSRIIAGLKNLLETLKDSMDYNIIASKDCLHHYTIIDILNEKIQELNDKNIDAELKLTRAILEQK